MNIDGILVPVITPFNAAGEVNYDALGELIELQLEAGVAGFVTCGTTGEYYALSEEEREGVLRFVAKTVGDRAALLAGVNDMSTTGSIAKAEQARALGYQGLMAAPPIYCLPGQHEIVRHFETLADAVKMPIVMYNFPARSGVEISVESVIELAKNPYIIGIKESSGDFSRALTLLNTDFDGFQVVCGSDDQGADYLAWGARSWIGGCANYLAADHVAMYKAAVADDHATVRAIMARLLPVIQNAEGGDYNQKAKLGVSFLGIDAGEIRAPLLPISEEDKAEFLAALKASLN
ncbi:dihydrodipicolinate synthase family protein [Parahaliea maris]|uniref:Dihydrodipicolinate synthase family protein n=1 Tax=Parahaliea maris TaxID=2716870 RepID=A0A5C9A1P1_9GAMM|nr:dihydrodipicolinate synthase family protein [Parahaliea maris]TXS93842.1 dihydrodipicolinate synthase family protein [Parahaliea maris]